MSVNSTGKDQRVLLYNSNNNNNNNNNNNDDDATTLGHCVHRIIEHAADKHSAQVALICSNLELTYVQLNARANHLARFLVDEGIQPGHLVGVALERSIDLVVTLLAVLKTGAAYVPIDTTFPANRIGQIVHDAGPTLILTGATILDALSPWKDICLGVDEVLILQNNNNNVNNIINNLDIKVQPEDLAYVMYTSGSTGTPKGVEMSHGALSNFLLSAQKDPGCDENDRMLAVTTISFDMAFLELFLPLICGATVVIAQAHQVRDMGALVLLIERHAINMMQGTPVAWQMLLESGWKGNPRLGKMLSAGEALPRRLAERLLACGDSLWNLYGPTETTYATCWKVCQGEDVLIGHPIANGRLYVLGDDMLPVPNGSSGELYVGGASVARGYRNKPELTQSRFLDNPFDEGRLYRTGDLACFGEGGSLSLLGRIDSQIKVRGYRVEPGDIEAAINDHWYVLDSVVASRDNRLVAYCVRDAKVPVAQEAAKAILDGLLRPWLAERLPAYMVPSLFVEMDALPVTLNCKIDRKALPDPLAIASQEPTAKPTTGLEQRILAVWSRVLGHTRIGVSDNFFEVGGDSMRVVRVQVELESLLGRPVSPAKLFEHYTIKTLAAYLAHTDKYSLEPIAAQKQPANNEDIAIVSMACRLPGDITTPEEYWELLCSGSDAIIDVPKDRWDADGLYDADPDARGKSSCRRGGFITSIDSFDAPFFGISPREARALDPLQHMVLETCWEGFERAGYTTEQLRGSQTGVFIGTSNIPGHGGLDPAAIRHLADLDGYTTTGSAGGTLSGRVSYVLGLEGPAMTIDTACSSSLVTTHLACTALRQGECDMAVSAGVSLMLNPGLHVEFSSLRGMSPDGSCRAFAADTQGTGWGEGSAVVVLKRLSDAQRDGDQIHAVLRGTAVNHDGRSAGLTAPSGPAQQRLIRSALSVAGLQPGDIDYIEAHGTGTKLGDPIEGTALAEVFGGSRSNAEDPLWIGSAKSNLGHTQASAGLVGMLKVVLAMQHSILPQTLYVTEPTPAVDWKHANLALVQEQRPWVQTTNRLRRAGVSAFGIGGTNSHAIVEEAPRRMAESDYANLSVPISHPVPFLLSGRTNAALRQQARKLYQHISNSSSTHSSSLGNVAYSLATTRNHFTRRLVLMAEDKTELLEKLASAAESSSFMSPATGEQHSQPNGEEAHLAMLFTGQGSQWPEMGRDLYTVYPIFREALDKIAAEFTVLEVPLLLNVMWADPGSDAAALLHRTDFAQPALFALEVSLWRLWQSWGVQPEYVLGHSVGELAAAHVAGIMNLPDACRLVSARGQLMQALPGHGKMASVETSAAEVVAVVKELGYIGKVEIAAYNTSTQTVVSGDASAVEGVVSSFTRQGCKTKMLDVSHAFHSHHMDGMLADFRAVAETVRFSPPRLGFVTSLTGKLAGRGQLEQAGYWVDQARMAVCFSDGIQTLAQQGVNIFLELGPRPVLCGMGAACLADDDVDIKMIPTAWVPSLVAGKNGASIIQRSLAELHMRNMPIDWHGYFKHLGCQRVELPTYAFQRERFRPVRETGAALSSQVASRVDRFEFEIQWGRVDADNNANAADRSWGLICPAGNAEWALDVKMALAGANIHLLQVDNIQAARDLDGLLCLWNHSDPDLLRQTRDLTAKALIQLQTAAKVEFVPPIVWVTRRAVGTGGDDNDNDNDNDGDNTMGLGAGTLWGLMRTARNEHPELHLRMIDLGKGDANIQAIPQALMLRGEPECAVRGGQVLIPQMQAVVQSPSPSPGSAQRAFVRQDGAVLITGGLGDLGQRVAKWLASTHGICDLVLASRRGMDTPGAKALVAELAQLGATATIVAANVANSESVQAVMEMFSDGSRPLRGVVHTAGLLDDGVISALTPERCNVPFMPKVDGAWHLHRLTRDMDLDLFVMFSSISGVMGMAGQGNYAAANTFLDALADMRRAEGLPATSVAWGLWGGEGMASKLNEMDLVRFSRLGLDALEPEDGMKLLEKAARSGRALTVAAAFDLERLGNFYESMGGIPPLLRSLLSRGDGSEQQPERSDRGWDLRKELSETAAENHAVVVLDMVRETVAKTLGFSSPTDVDVDLPLQNIGIDSLTAVLTRNQLAVVTSLTLSARIAFDYPNLRALSQFLLSQLQDSWADTSTQVSSGCATPSLVKESNVAVMDMATVRKGCLDPNFTFDNATRAPTVCPEAVFVTGATGFVGAFVVGELLQMGIAAHCLVRASSVDKAMQRLVATLSSYGLWKPDYSPLLTPIVGDLAQPLFGLAEEEFGQLADRVDAVCHSGALVDWLRPLEDYVGPNIVSTHEVLRLASRGRGKAVHLVSTVATLPKYLGYEVSEKEHEYGYATSKYTAERMVAAARWRGAKASVYRLPFVTASASTGHFRLDRGDFMHNLIVGSSEMGSFPSLDADLAVVLPIDYLAHSIVSVMTQDLDRIGHDFDFSNAKALRFDDFFGMMATLSRGQNILPFATWRQQALAYAATHPTSSLARIAAVVDSLDDEDAASAMLKGPPVGEHVFGGEHYPVPLIDELAVGKYLDCIDAARRCGEIAAL